MNKSRRNMVEEWNLETAVMRVTGWTRAEARTAALAELLVRLDSGSYVAPDLVSEPRPLCPGDALEAYSAVLDEQTGTAPSFEPDAVEGLCITEEAQTERSGPYAVPRVSGEFRLDLNS